MRREIWCFATALAALLSTAGADATPIEYSFSGTGDWTLNGLGAPRRGEAFAACRTAETLRVHFSRCMLPLYARCSVTTPGHTARMRAGRRADYQ